MSGNPVPVWKKYTTGSKGIWELFRKTVMLVPDRSSGNPYVPYYRVPAPSSNKEVYKDPRTFPAADIVENHYHERDTRRNYPQTSTFNQAKIGGLLQLGNVTKPRLLKGDEGVKQLSIVESDQVALTDVFKSVGKDVINGELLGANGECITAPNLNKKLTLRILNENEHGMYSNEYPVRIFTSAK
ncbi:hypothetical protein CANARDRAFT_30285 [[Candida] arabinofermentans NRRL YB-2248]|uniref:Uncharacterized protein n=1 Tax=[Candida] arabinofermentans NRRL YB-2248 TaxID=983967 RepID=A0A1E4SUD9_9ASCO|nr:hypothetical protein CANARDRAFT_30285 [[Candida] arabinofermentans NRRL YB-2248]